MLGAGNWDAWAGQFRFITVWGLTMSMISAFFMWRLTTARSSQRHEIFASVTVVVNCLLVFLYWKIFLADPFQLYEDGTPSAWWREYYIHGVGPALQLFDAFILLGVFRPIKKIAISTTAIILAYILWVEIFVAPMNGTPVGKATSGLPYPFLNDLEPMARALFYGQTMFVAFAFLAGGSVLAFILRRFKRA
jgi:hypothetical protein